MEIENELGNIFPEKNAETVRSLMADEGSKRLMIREIGRRLLDSPSITYGQSNFDQMICILSTAKFDYGDDEPVMVGRMIVDYSRRRDVLPYVIDHIPKSENKERVVRRQELGERCFIGLSLFYDKLQRRYERQSAPHPEFYREVGISAFRREGLPEIADNFKNWETFVRETFAWMNE
ncbi:MAG: hypothetical protein WCK90_01675 [archaeon]